MRNKISWGYKKSSILILILSILLIMSFPIVADNSTENSEKTSPSYKVSPPVVVLKVTPAANSDNISQSVEYCSEIEDVKSHDYLQGNMTVGWLNEPKQDLEFKITSDLTLNKKNSERNIGLINNNSSENVISPKYILAKRKSDSDYSSLNNWTEVLNSDSAESKLEFKLDSRIFDNNNWQDIEAGVYVGNISSNIDLPGNSNNRLNIVVIMEAVVNINTPDELKLTVEKPNEVKSSSINWSINTNDSSIKVKFESKGIELKDNEELEEDKDYIDYSKFFKYFVGNSEEFTDEFSPSSGKNDLNYTKGKLKLSYSADEYGDKEWYKLLAGSYEDTITITVSK